MSSSMRKVARSLSRTFAGLEVRYKLMILHNLFFVVLAAMAWIALVPQVSSQAQLALEREESLLKGAITAPGLQPSVLRSYDFRQGSAAELSLPAEGVQKLRSQPGEVYREPSSQFLYSADDSSGGYRRVTLPTVSYHSMVRSIKWTLIYVLAVIYCLAVLVLELSLMRIYIYRPLRVLLEADEASRRGDTRAELIDQSWIASDELGRLMISRNSTIRQLRQREMDLQRALDQLRETAEDLRNKNYLLEAAKENIAAQDRLASLGLLSASVAHELNTPLAVLVGSIEKLLESVQDRQTQERLQRMHRVTRRLQTVSENLLDFSRVRDQRIAPLSVPSLIQSAWELVAINEKSASIHFSDFSQQRDIVLGNSDRLEQLFVNVLRNALQAIQPGGHIQVRSRRQWEDGREWVVVSVEDDGPGVPPEVLPGIFEAFVTTRLDARGTGLGLTVAEGIAHQHGGTITASNRAEGGARLEVRLPAEPSARHSGSATSFVLHPEEGRR